MPDTSRLLMHERPLTVLPSLVKLLGFEKAVVLQQIFWLQNQPNSGRVLDDGERWIWGTYEEWCERYFNFWEQRTLRTHIIGLEKLGLVLSCQPKAADWDRTKYYRVDVEALERHIERTETVTSKRPDEATSNFDSSATSYKGTDLTTDLTTEPTTPTRKKSTSPPEPRAAAAATSLESRNRNLLRGKLGRRRDSGQDLLQQSLSEDDRRNDWLTLPEGRIEELIVEANPSARDGNFKTTLIGILDREVRQLRFKAATPPVAAAPPDAPDVSAEDQRYMQVYGADWREFKADDERYREQKERELERRKAHQTAQGSAGPN